ncbi:MULTISPECIES: restriction endonuclease subunit S [unclassified Xanthomonas]|uniref:restriction endonuclease subunit S n=1 Tax=unclassified Xanthomonas TaxID=2643310 RepID=UPI002882EE25|nr:MULTISPECIES: restriction endonuclease subunit S [unclassified Xanthomonas]
MSDTPNIDIRPDHWQIVRDILRKHVPQCAVWAFGSRAKWLAKQYSDLDLAIITDRPLSLAVSAALADDFSESDLPWKVDVIDWATAGESFRKIIGRENVVVQEAGRDSFSDTGNLTLRPLEECLDALIDYRGKTPRKVDFGIPLITAKVVKAGRIETPDEFIAEDDYEKWMTRGLPEIGDVVLTTEAPLGEVAQIKFLPVALAQRIVTLRGKRDVLDSRYLLYLLQSHDMQKKLLGRSSGTTVIGIKQSELRKIELTVLPLKEQCAIAHILGTLDDKIELNRLMNQTLEEMARALFKSWFVDFDGMPPECMQESDLGLIPQGWRVGRLDELLILQRGFDLPAQIRVAGKFPVVAAGGINGMHHKAMVKGPGIITGRSGVLGNVFFELSDFWPLNTTLWVKEFRVAKPCYAYELLRGLNFKQFNSGSAVPTLNRNHVHQLPQIIPPSEVIKKFEEEAMSLRKRIVSSERESRTLARLRDTLLPKLLSGELRVKDAERMAETI